jgi:hypothetical protein
MRTLPYKLTIATGIAAFALSGASVLAVSEHANAHATGAGQATASASPSASGSPSATIHGKGQAKLADAKLKACQKRETAINNIMTRTVDRGTKQIKVFDTIATRTEAFYTTKGKTVANYDALVLAVNDAKKKAETDLAALNTTASLKCDGTDPKGAASIFKANLKTEIADLKAYKTAVKNLIVGVKSAQGADSDTKTSPSPSTSPTASPTASPSTSPTSSPTTNQEGQ